MPDSPDSHESQEEAKRKVEDFQDDLGPFVVAAEATRMPTLFTNARSAQNDIIYVNESFLNLTGYEKSEALGMPFRCLLANEADRVEISLESIADRASSSIDLCCVRKDHTKFDAAVLASPVSNEDGELQQYFISLIDLTEHVQNRLRGHLREAEIYEHAPGFIAFTEGPEHRFAFANVAYECLVGHHDLVGKRLGEVLPELIDQGFTKILDSVYASGERRVGKSMPVSLKRGKKGDLETRFIDFLYEPVSDAFGSVVGVFCEGMDVTDARRTSQELNDMQVQLTHLSRINTMGIMAATLAHEVNQPLAAIVNYASGCMRLVEDSHSGGEDLHQGLIAITAAADRAGKIIIGLRDMTRRAAPAMEIFDLSNALEESVRLVRAGGCKDISLSTRCGGSLPVLGDKIQIEQVIINLVRNACQAAVNGERGEVLARSLLKDGRPCIVIRDNGAGLPASMRDNLFGSTETAKVDGMGIGLSISRTIAEAHGGIISVDETGPSGTSLTFSLPGLKTGKTTR